MGENKKIVIALISGLFILVLLLAFIFKILKDIPENSKALISQKTELNLLENKIAGLESFEREYKINKEELEKIDKLLLDVENPVDFINFLNFLRKTAADSGVSINISPPSPKKEVSGSPWRSIAFQISGSGKFLNLMRFLDKLKNSPYLLEVSGLSARAAREDEKKLSPDEININLFLTIFTIR
ncbi:MAG: hypothetical protein COT33_03435 [Candidatus Nealsonbacteria bacterium CG08_land_8_20_14_0_20_38_20]|uniref:Type 4a pilus biogenesis protein PilO n=1 Tax=Candidatus Nealsonbacteria bacterium CG08_land_8_20_14_0_20_38_20 TaxID=1974705 RepID=A0A2H0YL22_9BACT|nr:MAG: hypothetical protein COT33_03435 [Candidatus Nealsonbacteria bacterium CG08_land_8_20_14_0_20_38_20]